MKKEILLVIALIIFFCVPNSPQSAGHLVSIGGGDKTTEIMQKIVDLAGGKDSKIVVIPNASSEPLESAKYNVDEFINLGCSNISYLYCNREEANQDSNIKKLEGVTGIYFGGGDQAFLTRDLLGTKLLDKIFQIYNNGGVISGTSAGAAVMSKVMITGNELINSDSTEAFNIIEKGNIETIEGFGFITNAVIDQHFIKRKRNNRLITVILEHPKLLGIAIDESTAIVVNPDNTFEVIGESQVVIYDANDADHIKTNEQGKFAVNNLKMNILFGGEKFNMNNRKTIE